MSLKEIKELYRFLKNTDIVEFELEQPDLKVRLKRGVPQRPDVDVVQSGVRQVTSPGVEKEKVETKKNLHTVVSPMVGTFYRAPSPEAQPFVEMGSVVEKGQVLCIIEAMKLMNEVESEYGGKIVSILVDNGQPVEYGEPLFLLEP